MEYLFAFQFWYSKLCVENRWGRREGGRKHVLLIFVLWCCFTCRWVRGCGRKFYLGPAEILSFSSQDLSPCNKHDSFWLVISTGYFYILFLWAVVSDFPTLEIHKHLVLPLSNINFTGNSQAYNHFYKYIYLRLSVQAL